MAKTSSRDQRLPAPPRARGRPDVATRAAPTPALARATSTGDDEAYAAIHEAILDHRLPPGTKLKEVPLAQIFGITRNVVRKALQRLAHERLVELRVNRGAIVANPSIEESRHLFAARRAIEGAIVDSLSRTATRPQIRELRAVVQQEDLAYRRGEVRAAMKLSIEFHRVLARLAGNTVLAEFVDQLTARTPLVLIAYRAPTHAAGCSNEEHAQIVEAIASSDGDHAVALMRRHLDDLQGQLNYEEDQEPTADLAAIFGRTAGR